MALEIYKKRKHHIIFALYFLLFGSLVAIFTSTVNYNIEYTNIEHKITEKALWERQTKDELVRQFLEKTEDQVWALATNPMMSHYNHQNSIGNRKNLEDLFLAASEANRIFMQVRFLDSFGKERVRVDRNKQTNRPSVVGTDKLQDKSARYYFKEASQIPYGQFWHSKMDLNRERGAIETPIRPTFRVATPVFSNNQLVGIVIINLEVSKLLQILGSSSDFSVYIADQDGEFIVHPDESQAWGRYLEGRPNVYSQFPVLGKELMKLAPATKGSSFSFKFLEELKNRERLRMILIPKQEVLNEFEQNNLLTAGIIAALVVVISIPLSWLVAIGPSRLQDRLYKVLEKNRRHEAIIDRNVITSTTDRDGIIKTMSHAFLEIAKREPEEMIGHSHDSIKHPDTEDSLYEELWGTISQGKPWQGEIQNISGDGSSYWLDTVITPEFSPSGDILGYMSVSHDISDKKEIQRLSVTDQLTNLFNRRHLDDMLDKEMARFNRYGGPMSLIICDIDHFKSVNDQLGHQTGDKVLIAFADILKNCIRQTDCGGRWGGEEFAVICSETTAKDGVILAEKLRTAIVDFDFSIGRPVTASFGISEVKVGDTADTLLSRADKALYLAKDLGRNQVQEFNEV